MLYFVVAVAVVLAFGLVHAAAVIRSLRGERDLLIASLDGAHEEISRLRAGVSVELAWELYALRKFMLDHALVQRPLAKWFARVIEVSSCGVVLSHDDRVAGDDFVSF